MISQTTQTSKSSSPSPILQPLLTSHVFSVPVNVVATLLRGTEGKVMPPTEKAMPLWPIYLV